MGQQGRRSGPDRRSGNARLAHNLACLHRVSIATGGPAAASTSAGAANWRSWNSPLKNSSLAELELSVRGPLAPADIMFGGAPINGLDQPTVSATVRALLEAGVRDFDTAPLYGFSEERLGEALAIAPPALTDGVRVHTKIGLVEPPLTGADFTAAEVDASFARSLGRLRLDASDGSGHEPESAQPRPRYRCATLRIHHPHLVRSPGSLAEVTAPDGPVAAIAKIKAAGRIENVSMGMNTTEEHHGVAPTVAMIRRLPAGTFDSALLAYGGPSSCMHAAASPPLGII
eukprot:SAG31_NODE_8592_length_1424_cov_0.971321_1_plen_287_part_00